MLGWVVLGTDESNVYMIIGNLARAITESQIQWTIYEYEY